MAYIGQRPVIGRYIKLDQISSGFNGSNTGFNMTAGSQAVFPGTARNLLLSLGGVIQEPDTDFTIAGSVLTFTTPPVANTTFFGVIYGDMQATGTPSDGTVLPASIASSGHFKIPQLTVNEDGADVDFRVEGDTEANLLFVDASTDRVGIGTSTPASLLHVDGDVTIKDASPSILFSDDSGVPQNPDYRIQVNTGNFVINDDTNSQTRLQINSDGHVDVVGNLDVGAGLDVTGAIAATGNLTIESTSPTIFLTDTDNNSDFRINNSNGLFEIRDVTNTTTRFSIKSDGKVGIGSVQQTTPLEVAYSDANASDFTTSASLHDGTNVDLIAGMLKNSGSGNSEVGLLFESGDTQFVQWSINAIKTGSFVGDLAFRTRTGGQTAAERMRLDSSGRLGIGTTSLAAKLHVTDTAATIACLQRTSSTANVALRFQNDTSSMFCGLTSTATGFAIDDDNDLGSGPMFFVRRSDGNVGVGTGTPTGTLSLSDQNPNIRFDDEDTSNNGEITLDNTQLRIECDEDDAVSSSAISFRLDGSERASIDANGLNITQKLLHEGDNDTFLEFLTNTICFDTAGSERARITSTGLVGIGTTSPGGSLDIGGNVNDNIQAIMTRGSDTAFQVQFRNESSSNASNVAVSKFGLFRNTVDIVGMQFHRGIGLAGGNLSFTVGGTEKMRMDSSGRFGIGTLTCQSLLHVQGSGNDIELFRAEADLGSNQNRSIRIVGPASDSATAPFRLATGNSIAFEIDATQRMIIDESGQVGIGADPASILHISSGTAGDCELIIEADTDNSNENDNPRIIFRQDGGSPQSSVGIGNNTLQLRNGVSSSGGIIFATTSSTGHDNATEKMRVLTGGDVRIGASTSDGRLGVKSGGNGSGSFCFVTRNSDNSGMFSVRNDGAIFTGALTAAPYNFTTTAAANCNIQSNGRLRRSTSSIRYKKDITDATWGLAEVLKLKPVTYKSNGTGENTDDKTYGGFTAEDIHDLGLTEFVEYNESNQPDALHYGNMVALMAKAIQELSAKVAVLEAA